MQWFKSFQGAPVDPKWLRVAHEAGQSVAVVMALAWAYLDHASQAKLRGDVSGFNTADAAFFMGEDVVKVAAVAAAFEKVGWIVGGRIANWDKYQGSSSTERVRKHRERREHDGTSGTVSSVPRVTETHATEETPRGDKIREDKNNSTPPTSPAAARAEPTIRSKWGLAVKGIIEERWPDDPGVAMLNTGLVEQWYADGYDLDLDVAPIVRQLVADKRGSSITTLKYFTTAIQRRHTERTMPEGAGSVGGGASSDPQTLQWRARVRGHRKAVDASTPPIWLPSWGPPPGEPACQAPADVLAEFGFQRPIAAA